MAIPEHKPELHFLKTSHQKVSFKLLRTAKWIEWKQKDFFAAFGLTKQQFQILSILREEYPESMSGATIKIRMLEKRSDISRLLNRLAIKNMITQDHEAKDKRARNVLIENKGLELMSSIDFKLRLLDGIVGKLSGEEAEQLSYLLDKISN